jgi:hypothetical protein
MPQSLIARTAALLNILQVEPEMRRSQVEPGNKTPTTSTSKVPIAG